MKLSASQQRLQKNAVIIAARQCIYNIISQEFNSHVRIDDISEVITKGTTPQTYGFDFVLEGTAFLRAEDILDGEVCYRQTTLFIDPETNKFMNRSRTHSGDILITIAGTIGRAAVVPETAPELNMNQAVSLIRCKESINPYYVCHMLQAHDIQQQITKSTVTSAISNLSLNKIKDLRIPLPPLKDQNRIAMFLEEIQNKQQQLINHDLPNYIKDIPQLISKITLLTTKIEEARGLRREAITEIEVLQKQVYELAWFGAEKETEEETLLENIAEVIDPQPDHRTPAEVINGMPYVSIANIDQNGKVDFSSARKVSDFAIEHQEASFKLQTGDIVLGKIGTVGAARPIIVKERFALSANVVLVQPHRDKVLDDFLLTLLRSPQAEQQFISGVHSSAQGAFGIKKMRKLVIPIPPISTQTSLMKRFNALHSMINVLMLEQSDTTKELDALLPSILNKAFKGEL